MPTPTVGASSDDDVTLSLPGVVADSFRSTVSDLLDGIAATGTYRGALQREPLEAIASGIGDRGDLMVSAPQGVLVALVEVAFSNAVDRLDESPAPTSTVRHHLLAVSTWADVIDGHDWLSAAWAEAKPDAAFTLLIPQPFLKLFRQGVVKSARSDIDALSRAVDKKHPRVQVGDLASGAAALAETVALLEMVPESSSEDDVTLADPPPSATAHAFESMAREVCGPLIENVLSCGPFEDDVVSEIQELTRAVDWAAERAVACHDQAAKEA